MNSTTRVAAGLSVLFAAMLPYGRAANRPIAELPIAFEKNLPLVSFRVNGSPLTLILDSASVNCVIDGQAATDSGIEADDSAFSTGSGGMLAVKLARGVQLRQEGVEVNLDYAVVTSLDGLRFGRPIHGIAGLPLFRKYVVEIDYRGSTVRFYSPAAYRPPATGQVIRAWMADGPTVKGRLRLPGHAPLEADFQVDTGSSHVLTICRPFVDKHRMLARMRTLTRGGTVGLGGSSPDMVGRIDSVAVGPFSVRNPEVRFSTASSGSFASTRFSANLGNGFLNRYTVTFDLANSRLILTP